MDGHYESLAKWFGIGEKSKFGIWVKWVIISLAVLLILFFTMSLILRVQVKSKTNELLMKNEGGILEINYTPSISQPNLQSIKLKDIFSHYKWKRCLLIKGIERSFCSTEQ